MSEEICCPKFDPTLWDGKEHMWNEKLFVKGYVNQIFHIPLNIGSVISKLYKKVEESKAQPPLKDFLMLAYDPSPWKSEIYVSVTHEVESLENVKLSGKYISKVFDGPFNAVPQWIKQFDEYLKEKNLTAKKYYFYYTTCPKCIKKYGHNYVVAFAQI